MIHLFTNKNLSEFSLEKSFCYTFYYTLAVAVTIVCVGGTQDIIETSFQFFIYFDIF